MCHCSIFGTCSKVCQVWFVCLTFIRGGLYISPKFFYVFNSKNNVANLNCPLQLAKFEGTKKIIKFLNNSICYFLTSTILALLLKKLPKFAKHFIHLPPLLETLGIKMTAEMNTQRNEREPLKLIIVKLSTLFVLEIIIFCEAPFASGQ